MLSTAEEISNFKGILLDKNKYFKSDYELLPIPDLDLTYFRQQNTLYLIDYNPLLGAIFLAYKQDVYILERENTKKFFVKGQNKVLKQIKVLPAGGDVIHMIKLSPCANILAVVSKKNIKLYSVKDMLTQGIATLLASFEGENDWEIVNWAPRTKEDDADAIVAVDSRNKLCLVNFTSGQNKYLKDQQITCATFSKDREYILALNKKCELLVMKNNSLEITRIDKPDYIDFVDSQIFTDIQEIKPNFWVFSGVNIDEPDNPLSAIRTAYIFYGNIATEKLSTLKVQLYEFLLSALSGNDNPDFVNPYYRIHHILQNDVTLFGNSEGDEVKMVLNQSGNPADTKPENYVMLEQNDELMVKIKAPSDAGSFLTRLRGFIFYTNKLSDDDIFEYIDNDEEKQIPSPPFIISLTQYGQLVKYAFIEKRPQFAKVNFNVEPVGVSALRRNIQLKGFGTLPVATPVTQIPVSSQREVAPPKQPQIPVTQSQIPATQPKATISGPPISGSSISGPSNNVGGGIVNPKQAKLKEMKARVVNNIEYLNKTYKELVQRIKDKVIMPIDEEDKKFYSNWRSLEMNVYECKEFLKKASLFCLKQEHFKQQFDKILSNLEGEAQMMRDLISEGIIEGKDIKPYTNTELKFQVEGCLNHQNSLLYKLEHLESFLKSYKDLENNLPTNLPEVICSSPTRVSTEKVSFTNSKVLNPRTDFYVNTDSITKSMRLSKTSIDQQGAGLTKSTPNLKLGRSSGLKRLQFSQNLRQGIHYVESPSSMSPSPLIEPDYQKQLKDLHRKLKDALTHSMEGVKKTKETLNGLQKQLKAPIMSVSQKTTTPYKESQVSKKPKKGSRKIYFPVDDEDFEESDDGIVASSFFENILKDAQTSKLSTVKVQAFPFQKYDDYRGPKLEDLEEGKDISKISLKDFSASAAKPSAASEKDKKEASMFIKGPTAPVTNVSNIKKEDLKDQKTGFLSFNLPSKQPEEEKKTSMFGGQPTPAPKITTAQLPGEDKSKTEANRPPPSLFNKPAEKAPATSLFDKPAAKGPTVQPEEKKLSSSLFAGSKPEEKKAPSSLFPGAPSSTAGTKPETDNKPKPPGSSLFDMKPMVRTETKAEGEKNILVRTETKAEGEKNIKSDSSSLFGNKGPAKEAPKPAETKPSISSSLFGGITASSKDKQEPTSAEGPSPSFPTGKVDAPSFSKASVSKNPLDDAKFFGSSPEESKDEDGTDKMSSSFISSSSEKEAEERKTQEPKLQTNKSEPPKGSLKSTKSILNDLSKGGDDKDFLKKLLSKDNAKDKADDDALPDIPLVRDDSFVPSKSEAPPPKMDLFKTMSGKPPFLQNKPSKPESKESKDDIIAALKASSTGQSTTLFTKKINEPKKEEEKAEPPAATVTRPRATDNADSLFGSLSISQPGQGPKPETPIKPTQNIFGSTQQAGLPTIQSTPTIPANKVEPIGGLVNQQPKSSQIPPLVVTQQPGGTPNSLFSGTNGPAANMFSIPAQNQPLATGTQIPAFAQPQNRTGNMFAINVTPTQGASIAPQGENPTGPAFGKPNFGTTAALPTFGAPSQPVGGASHGAGMFGHTQSTMPAMPKVTNPPQQQGKLFGSGFGVNQATNNANAGANAGGGSGGSMLFSSAVQGQQSGGSFLGSGSSQANFNFASGGGMLGAVRKSKQI